MPLIIFTFPPARGPAVPAPAGGGNELTILGNAVTVGGSAITVG